MNSNNSFNLSTLPQKDLNGTIEIPGDKSISHRAIILSSIAEGITKINNYLDSSDIEATIRACESIGAVIHHKDRSLQITGNSMQRIEGETIEFDLTNEYKFSVQNIKKTIYGTFDEHMKWWKARSEQIISEIQNKNDFMNDLKEKLEKINTKEGIPFDLSVLYINLKGKK